MWTGPCSKAGRPESRRSRISRGCGKAPCRANQATRMRPQGRRSQGAAQRSDRPYHAMPGRRWPNPNVRRRALIAGGCDGAHGGSAVEPIRSFRGTLRPAIVCAVSEFIGKARSTCHRGVLWREAWRSSCAHFLPGPLLATAGPTLTPVHNHGEARTSMRCSVWAGSSNLVCAIGCHRLAANWSRVRRQETNNA